MTDERPSKREITKVALACLIGTTIEWYDFFLYGTAAALVFNRLFFPTFEPLAGTLAAFATFAVGFVARPLGGAVFGHFGDRLGRKLMLSLSLLIMGAASFCIGLLPTYAHAGLLAPCLLVSLRILQGIGIGGEWGGAVVLAFEHAPPHRRGFFGSLPQVGVPAGLLLGTLVFWWVSRLPESDFLSYGWRLPFLGSIVLVAIGLVVRLRIAESPLCLQQRALGLPTRAPLLEAVSVHWRRVLIAMGARLAENAFFYVYTVFMIVYATQQLGVTRDVVLRSILAAAALQVLSLPLFGLLSDIVGRKPVYLFGAIFSALFSFPFFILSGWAPPGTLTFALILGLAIGHAAMYGPQASFFSELFDTQVRYSGASLGYQLASVVAGGLSPMIATKLLDMWGGKPWGVTLYMFALGIVTIAALLAASETRGGRMSTKRSLTVA